MRGKEQRLPPYPLAQDQPERALTRPHINQLSEKQLENFWCRVDKSKHGCWQWLGGCNNHGRGNVKLYGVQMLAPRVMYALEHGVDPGAWDILHTCDDPGCVRPDHLFLGTPKINADDRATKGRFVASLGNTKLDLTDPKTKQLLESTLPRDEIAARLGVNPRYLSRLWKQLGYRDRRTKGSPKYAA